MAVTLAVRPIGPTMGLSVAATSHAAVTLLFNGNDTCNYVSVNNTSTSVAVAVNLSANGAAAVLPSDGAAGNYLVPPLEERVIAVPSSLNAANLLQVTAIGTAAGPSLIGVTPLGAI